MDEADAVRSLQADFNVPRETIEQFEAFVGLLQAENARQNLVSRESLQSVWKRHILDSVQLLRFVPASAKTWLDLGTGAGFPGLVVAAMFQGRVRLVEERRKRCDFLQQAADTLGVTAKTEVICSPAQRLALEPTDIISARAFAPLDRLLVLGLPFSTPSTRWILPKGRNAKSELEALESSWQGSFCVEPSLTDPDAGIIVADGVSRLGKGQRL